MRKFKLFLPITLCLLFIFYACVKKDILFLNSNDEIENIKIWLHTSGGPYKNEILDVQPAKGNHILGNLDWEKVKKYNWNGRNYVDIPFIFNDYGEIIPEYNTTSEASFHLLIRPNRDGGYEGALRTTMRNSNLENIITGNYSISEMQTITTIEGKQANIWYKNIETNKIYKAEKRDLTEDQVLALRKSYDKLSISQNNSAGGGKGSLMTAPANNQQCFTYSYNVYYSFEYPASGSYAGGVGVGIKRMYATVCFPISGSGDDNGDGGVVGGGGSDGDWPPDEDESPDNNNNNPDDDECQRARNKAQIIKTKFNLQAFKDTRAAAGDLTNLKTEKGFALYENVSVDSFDNTKITSESTYTSEIFTDNSQTGVTIPTSVSYLKGLVASWHNHPIEGYAAPSPPDVFSAIMESYSNIGNYTTNSYQGRFIESANGDIYALVITNPILAYTFLQKKNSLLNEKDREWMSGSDIAVAFNEAQNYFLKKFKKSPDMNNLAFENAMGVVLHDYLSGVSLLKLDRKTGDFNPIIRRKESNINIKGQTTIEFKDPCE